VRGLVTIIAQQPGIQTVIKSPRPAVVRATGEPSTTALLANQPMRVPETPPPGRQPQGKHSGGVLVLAKRGMSSARNIIETVFRFDETIFGVELWTPVFKQETNGWRCCNDAAIQAMRCRAMKRCAQCHGRLGLGVRSRNLWDGRWWVHVRFCSIHCEALYELEQYDANARRRRTLLVPSDSQR
jgi:hypothetical protein